MTKIKLSYFDIDGGRAEPIRLIMNWGDIAFEDFRFPFTDFAEVRKCTPFGQVPCMEINGEVITQTNALIRYFGKQAGLYPEDDYQALLCDEVMNVIEDASNKLVATFGLEGEALKTAREALASGPLTTYLKWLEARLQKTEGPYFNGEQISIADFKIFVWTRGLCAGHLDHIPTTLVEQVAPTAMKHLKHMSQLGKIKNYYKNR
jgi:glutathione S-transferase